MDQEKSRFSASTAFSINLIGTVVAFLLLKELREIFIPLVIAYFLFFVFTPLNEALYKKKIPPYLAIIIDLLIIILVFGGISSVIIDSFGRLGEALPGYEARLNQIVSSTASSMGVKNPQFLHFKIADVLQSIDYGLLAGSVFSSTFSMLGSAFFVLFFFIFVFTGHHNIYEAIRKWYLKSHVTHEDHLQQETQLHHEHKVTETKTDEGKVVEEVTQKKHLLRGPTRKEKEIILQDTFQEIVDQIQKYVASKFFISLGVGIVTGIVCLIFGVDFVVVWAVLTFMLNFIPNIGALIAVVLPFLVALVQFGSIGYALLLAAILVVIHNIFGNIIEPRIFGHRLGLNPLVILLSLLLWGYIWGVVGALLSVPLTAILKIIISRSASPNVQFISDLMS